MAILQIDKTPRTLTITKAKVVSGNFGAQLFCVVVDAEGQEHTMYLPWASQAGAMSGVVQQFIKAGVIGPEDFTSEEGVYYDQIKDRAYTFARVFKDGKQFINVDVASGAAALHAAAQRDLDLVKVAANSAPSIAQPARQAPAPAPRATIENVDALADKALAKAINDAVQLAEAGFAVTEAFVQARAATLLIAYQKEGIK